MPQAPEGPDIQIADCIMSVAESTSLRAFGGACQRAIHRLTGSSTIGVYMLKSCEPQLLYSRNVPDGFLADYRNGMAKCDPLIERVLEDGQVVDGASLYGPHGWPRSIAFDLLHSWGFSWNMCGPLRCEDRIVGIVYTATPRTRAPYTPALRQRMGVLCRAASVALTNMLRAGELDRPDAGIGGSLPVIRGTPSLQHLLPPRSAEVALRVCRGQTNKEIARDMGISDQTVKEHVANLFRRFGAHNRTELVTCLLNGLSRQ
jgi:DNA-binding CsgD family transcriptional regulator